MKVEKRYTFVAKINNEPERRSVGRWFHTPEGFEGAKRVALIFAQVANREGKRCSVRVVTVNEFSLDQG